MSWPTMSTADINIRIQQIDHALPFGNVGLNEFSGLQVFKNLGAVFGAAIQRQQGCAQLAQQIVAQIGPCGQRSEEHTSELQSLMRISYAVFCLKKKTQLN